MRPDNGPPPPPPPPPPRQAPTETVRVSKLYKNSDQRAAMADSYLTSGRWAMIGGGSAPPPDKPLVVKCLGKRRYVVFGMGKHGLSKVYRSAGSASRALARWNRRKKADAEAIRAHEAGA
jgi:hypothetical protein